MAHNQIVSCTSWQCAAWFDGGNNCWAVIATGSVWLVARELNYSPEGARGKTKENKVKTIVVARSSFLPQSFLQKPREWPKWRRAQEGKFNTLLSSHPFCKRRRKRKDGITETTDEVGKRTEKRKLVFAGIFPLYVLALLFAEFMVFQGYAILRLLLYWSQFASDC